MHCTVLRVPKIEHLSLFSHPLFCRDLCQNIHNILSYPDNIHMERRKNIILSSGGNYLLQSFIILLLLLLVSQSLHSLNFYSHAFMLIFLHQFLFFRRRVLFVTFSCAVTGIIVRMQNDVCQIVVEKRKRDIVGEQLLPLCKIVFSELKLFEGSICSFAIAQKIPERLFPLDSDREVSHILTNDPEKARNFEGSQVLAHFRNQLRCITNVDDDLEVSTSDYFTNVL